MKKRMPPPSRQDLSLKQGTVARPAPEPQTELRPDNLDGVLEDVREGDGLDPREEAKRKLRAQRQRRPGLPQTMHRQERFLGQVRQAIDFALQLTASPILNALMVRDVVDQGGALVVVVSPRESSDPFDTVEANQALREASSMFSRELAREITRKECPKLSFVVLPSGTRKLDG